jgi:hypothetical protein
MLQSPIKWSELCASDEYQGRWVALDGCRYDEATAKPLEGTVIDSDEDLVELCNRIRDAGGRECAILYIEQEARHTGWLPRARAVH